MVIFLRCGTKSGMRSLGEPGGSAFALILNEEPFDTWNINDRYSDCQGLTSQIVTDRLSAAQQIVGYLQNAKVLGGLP